MSKGMIKLVIVHENGRRTEVVVKGPSVTPTMLEVAAELLETLSTGERPTPRPA